MNRWPLWKPLTAEGPAKAIAENLLMHYGRHFAPDFEWPEPAEERAHYRREQDAATGQQLVVAPNPTSGVTQFIWKNPGNGAGILLIEDVQGQAVGRFDIADRVLWDTSALPSGLYFYRLSSGGKPVFSGKIVIKH